jgi:hypothetical protein
MWLRGTGQRDEKENKTDWAHEPEPSALRIEHNASLREIGEAELPLQAILWLHG